MFSCWNTEYVLTGGDLQYYLNKHGMFAEENAKFYMCEIILGLEYLHENNIVHRDIKVCSILCMYVYASSACDQTQDTPSQIILLVSLSV